MRFSLNIFVSRPHRKDGVGSLGLQAAATNLKKANSCILRCVQIELMIKMIANCRLNYLYAFAFTALRITLASKLVLEFCIHCHKQTVLRPFFRDYPGEPVPEKNLLLDFIVQGKITEADTPSHRPSSWAPLHPD